MYVCVCMRRSTYVGRPTTRHSGAPELLRAVKPHLPPSISNRLPRAAVCYIIKNGSCSKTRLRAFAARTLSAVILCHCLDNNAPRISNRSLERLVMPGDFGGAITRRRENVWIANYEHLLTSPRENTEAKRRESRLSLLKQK